MSRGLRRYLWIVVTLFPALGAGAEQERIVKIGVRSLQTPDRVKEAWNPTASFLSSEIAGTRFEIVPLTGRQSYEAVVDHRIDFLLTDPAEFVELEVEQGLRTILTLVKLREGVACDKEGSVVIRRSDRNDLKRLVDLEGKTVAAISPNSFEGWIAVRHELMKRGIEPSARLCRNAVSAFSRGSGQSGLFGEG